LTIHPIEERQFIFGNNRPYLTETEAVVLKHSLELVLIENMIIKRPKKTKAEFTYKGKRYENISVTDPRYYSCDNGTYIGDAIIVASIPDEPFTVDEEERYYKFIAQIFPLNADISSASSSFSATRI
jgi:hypothetical protein